MVNKQEVRGERQVGSTDHAVAVNDDPTEVVKPADEVATNQRQVATNLEQA